MTMTFFAASSLLRPSRTRLTASPNTTRFAPFSRVEPTYRYGTVVGLMLSRMFSITSAG